MAKGEKWYKRLEVWALIISILGVIIIPTAFGIITYSQNKRIYDLEKSQTIFSIAEKEWEFNRDIINAQIEVCLNSSFKDKYKDDLIILNINRNLFNNATQELHYDHNYEKALNHLKDIDPSICGCPICTGPVSYKMGWWIFLVLIILIFLVVILFYFLLRTKKNPKLG